MKPRAKIGDFVHVKPMYNDYPEFECFVSLDDDDDAFNTLNLLALPFLDEGKTNCYYIDSNEPYPKWVKLVSIYE